QNFVDVSAFWHVVSQAELPESQTGNLRYSSLALQGRNILHNNAAYANSLGQNSYEKLRDIWIRNYHGAIFSNALPRATTERQRRVAEASQRQDRSLSRKC